MEVNPKRTVEAGSNRIAKRYLDWSQQLSQPGMDHLQDLLARLPNRQTCWNWVAGREYRIPRSSTTFAGHCQRHLGAQIRLAKQHVPEATLINADMMSLDFPPETFDAIVGFYSIIHVPRLEQCVLFNVSRSGFAPEVIFLSIWEQTRIPGSVNPDWLGSAMFWSSYDAETNQEMIRDAGLTIVDAKVMSNAEHGEAISFLWLLARKTAERLE